MTGFANPNHTEVPNDLFDKFLPLMHESELKVVLHAIRKTRGYHRGSDEISLSQFVKATGLSRQAVMDGLRAATERGIIRELSKGKRGIRSYQLVYSGDQSTQATSLDNRPEPVYSGDQTAPRLVYSVDTQNKEEIKQRETKKSSSARAKVVNPLVAQIKAHPAWQAFERGWDGIEPGIEPTTADITLNALSILADDLSAEKITLQDIENTTRWKLAQPRVQGYRITFVKADIGDYRALHRPGNDKGSHAPARTSSGDARASPTSPPPIPVQSLTPEQLAARIREKERILAESGDA